MKTEAARAGFLLAVSAVVFLTAYQAPGDIFLDFGPNDYPYVRGFREDFEIDEPTFIHWSGDRGRIVMPFLLPDRPFELVFRYKRHVRQPAEIRVYVDRVQVDRFIAPRRDFVVRSVTVKANPRPWAPVEITFLTRSDDPRPLGLALDWLQIRPRGWVIPYLPAFLFLLGVPAGIYAVTRLIGFSSCPSLVLGLGSVSVIALWAGLQKLAPVHAASTLGLRWHTAALLVVAFARYRSTKKGSSFSLPEARWALLAFYLGTTFRLMGLFHSEFYYPDVRTHSKFVSLIWTEGLAGFFSDYIAHQHQHLLGLQLVGGHWLAFPYPPLLYLTIYPLSLLSLPVDEWMKLVPTLLVGIEALVLYVMVVRLGLPARAAAAASWFHATAPLLAFRLTVASYAALFGHFWDTLTALYLLFFFKRMTHIWVGLGVAALVAVSILSYAGGALVLGMFIPVFSLTCLWRRRDPTDPGRAVRTLVWALAGASLAIAVFYTQYIPELLPAWVNAGPSNASPSTLVESTLTPLAALEMAAHRLNLFYGPVFGLLLFLGLFGFRKRSVGELGLPLSVGVLATYLGLNFLRSGLGQTHIFQFTKDDLVLLPLAAVVYGNWVDRWVEGGRWRKAVGAALLAGWVGWGIVALVRDVRSRFVRPDYPPEESQTGQSFDL